MSDVFVWELQPFVKAVKSVCSNLILQEQNTSIEIIEKFLGMRKTKVEIKQR